MGAYEGGGLDRGGLVERRMVLLWLGEREEEEEEDVFRPLGYGMWAMVVSEGRVLWPLRGKYDKSTTP